MLEKYRAALGRVPPVVRMRVLNYFKLPPLRGSLFDQLSSENLGQADLVLCLLRINDAQSLRLAERLVGHPIVVCPPCLRLKHARLPTRRYADGDVRVRVVKRHNPFLPTCPAFQRWRMLRDGMLLSEYRARGIVVLEKVA